LLITGPGGFNADFGLLSLTGVRGFVLSALGFVLSPLTFCLSPFTSFIAGLRGRPGLFFPSFVLIEAQSYYFVHKKTAPNIRGGPHSIIDILKKQTLFIG